MKTLAQRVEHHLGRLVGLPLWAMGRTSDLLWLQFGEKHLATSFRGAVREVGDHALHIQCNWELRDDTGVIVDSRGDHIDEALDRLQVTRAPMSVERVTADEKGGFQLFLEGSRIVRVVPDASAEEQWRLLQPYQKTPHIALMGGSLDESA